jgi:hypothetical protein
MEFMPHMAGKNQTVVIVSFNVGMMVADISRMILMLTIG